MTGLPNEFRLPSRMTRVFGETFLSFVWALGAIAAGGMYFHYGGLAEGGVLVTVGLLLAMLSSSPTAVVVGADGVVVRWAGMRRFISYASVTAVEPHVVYARSRSFQRQRKSSGVILRRRDGADFYLVCDDVTARDLRAAVGARLLEHRGRARAELPALARGDRNASEWARAVSGLLDRRGYRESSVTTEDLWGHLENPKNEAGERAAAALALRAHLGEEARPRLRVAIDGCAEPKLRVALEAIEEEDAAETEKQLARLSRK